MQRHHINLHPVSETETQSQHTYSPEVMFLNILICLNTSSMSIESALAILYSIIAIANEETPSIPLNCNKETYKYVLNCLDVISELSQSHQVVKQQFNPERDHLLTLKKNTADAYENSNAIECYDLITLAKDIDTALDMNLQKTLQTNQKAITKFTQLCLDAYKAKCLENFKKECAPNIEKETRRQSEIDNARALAEKSYEELKAGLFKSLKSLNPPEVNPALSNKPK